MSQKPPLRIYDISASRSTNADLAHHVPDVFEIDLRHDDAGVPSCTGHRQGHVWLRLASEIDGAVVDPVGESDLEPVVGRIVGSTADAVFGLTREAQLLSSLVVEQRQLGDGRNLAQEPQSVELTLLGGLRRPGQVGHPTELAFDLLDELADLGGRRCSLLFLEADGVIVIFTVREPDVDEVVCDECGADDRCEQHNVLAEQGALDRSPDQRYEVAEDRPSREFCHWATAHCEFPPSSV